MLKIKVAQKGAAGTVTGNIPLWHLISKGFTSVYFTYMPVVGEISWYLPDYGEILSRYIPDHKEISRYIPDHKAFDAKAVRGIDIPWEF